jgi:ParB/RepB/Spo0J family partition protein
MADIAPTPRQVDLEADLSAPRGMLLPIGDIHPAKDNLRRVSAGEDADRMMRDSVAAAGIFTPILVRPIGAGAGWEVIDGHRRLAAAEQAGVSLVPVTVRASTDAEQMAIQAATNLVRAPLSELDRWEAVKRLQERGYSIEDAARTLGLTVRQGQRISLLAHLHPDILKQIQLHGMPATMHLATIAKAPAKTQQAALKRPASWRMRGKEREISWYDLSIACMQQRIPQGRAVFDIAKSKVVFEEDLFAQPGSEDQFATRDVAGFLREQTAALEREAAASKGKVEAVPLDSRGGPMLPKGWIAYAMGPKPKGLVTYKSLVQSGPDAGSIVAQQAAPKPKPEKKKPATAPAEAADTETATAPASGRGPITQAGLDLIAKAQTEALGKRMRDIAAGLDEAELLELLLLTLCANNVTVHGPLAGGYSARVTFDDVSRTLLDERAEQRELEPLQARRLAGDVIARCLTATARGGYGGSGAPAQWIGRWIEAGAAMPRLDRPEILATLSLDTLREAAFAAGLKPAATAKGLREQLAGQAPALTLPPAAFAASGPQPIPNLTEED